MVLQRREPMSAKGAISFLKKAVKMEYNDVFLYHKEKQSPLLNDKIKGIFEAFGNQETAHLDIFSVELKKIADDSTIEIAPPIGAKTLREILSYHKGQEEAAISFYEAFYEGLEEGEFKKKLSRVIADEKTHLEILNNLLKEI